MLLRLSICVLLVASFTACSANVRHEIASNGGNGIRYYRTSAYLLVYSNGKGGLNWQILYLPDPTKLMMARPSVVGGRSEVTMYFKNGALTGSTEVGDTTALPRSIIASIQSALPLFMAAAETTPGKFPPPSLYKIVVHGSTVTFVGGQGDGTPISVPVSGG